MNKLKYVFISSIIIFLFNFPAHFMYDWFPFKFISFFFPVNESIFEHLKMIFTSYCIFYLILSFFKKKLNYQNLSTTLLVSSLSTIISFLIIYLPFTLIFKEVFIVTIIILFLSICLGEYIASFILNSRDYKTLNYISLFIILLILILNASLTYNPFPNYFFYDNLNHTYGIIKN